MRILIINFEYPPLGGGGGIATRDAAQELAKAHTVHVITTHFQQLATKEVCQNVVIHRVRVWGRDRRPTGSMLSMITFVPAALYRGFRLTSQVTFDVINAQFVVPSGIPAALLCKIRKIPFVISFIGGDIYDPTKQLSPHRFGLLRALVRAVARQAQSATAISEDTKKRVLQMHGVTLPITVTPLGVDIRHIPSRSRVQLGLPATGTIFVSIGRLIERKGFAQLLTAWQSVSGAHLVIIGEGPLRITLEQLRAALQLDERVHLMGFVNDDKKMQILAVATAYVSAASHEGFGLVFLEAMAAGLPIIATNNGGQMDFLAPNVNALLVPVNNRAALVEAIVRVQNSPELRSAMSQANREKVKQFSIAATTARFEQVLLDAVATTKRL